MESKYSSLNELWDKKYKENIPLTIQYIEPVEEKPPNHIRFVIISDTHEAMGWEASIPDGDVLLHCGDFTMLGGRKETTEFLSKFTSLPHKHKVLIAGNHELTFDTEKFKMKRKVTEERFPYLKNVKDQEIKALATENKKIIYLENSSVVVENYLIYGNPVQPYFYDWGFNVRRHNLKEIWKHIPDNADIVMTHGPPLGIGDLCEYQERSGDEDLLLRIREVKPKIHCFGHIHEDYGLWKDENTLYANASICDIRYVPKRKAIVIDLPEKSSI